LIDLARAVPPGDHATVAAWIDREITGHVVASIRAVIDRYLDDTPHDDEPWYTRVDRAERELVALL
jgi:hypothetical protein